MTDQAVTIERPGKARVLCTVRIEEADRIRAESTAIGRLGASVSIKGFRAGHAPVELVRERLEPGKLLDETIRVLLGDVLPMLVDTHGIRPIIPPRVEMMEKEPLTLRITLVERPEVSIRSIDTFDIEKKEVEADARDVQRILDSVVREHRTVTPADRPAQDGDEVVVDLSATDEKGNDIPALRVQKYDVTIGSKTLLPGLEEQLIGLSKGESKECTITLPEKFGLEELRNKAVTMHVTMQEVRAVQTPVLDDAFAKAHLQAQSADEFRAFVERTVREQEESAERMRRERLLMEEIRARTTVDLPDELLEEELHGLVEDWSKRLTAQGKTLQEALKDQGKTPEEAEKELRNEALERWKLRLGLAKLIDHLSITVTDEALEERFEEALQSATPERQVEARKEWNNRGPLYEEVRWRAMVDSAVDQLLA